MRPLLALVMIVKDEAVRICETLVSVRPFVDSWVILDTGSSDGTQTIINEAMADVPGPGLFEEPFVPFEGIQSRRIIHYGKTRNRALAIHDEQPNSAVFTLMLSGDEKLVGGAELRVFLEQHRDAPDGAYCVEMSDGRSTWPFPRVLRAGGGWRYKGAVHEVPVGPKGETRPPSVPAVRVVHEVSDPARRQRRYREVDLPVLSYIAGDEGHPIEDRAQAIWHLGQTHEAIAESYPRTPGSAWVTHKMAAMSMYQRRADIEMHFAAKHGDDIRAVEDKFSFAVCRSLNVAEQIGLYDHEEMVKRLRDLVGLNPRLPEARYMLAVHEAAIDVRKGVFLAEEAIRAAREVRENPSHMPADTRVEWLACRLAAACAAEKDKKWAKTFAEMGVKAGGPREAFAEWL